jgi:LysR family hydrogen peroxide-inducible transcriptional activator
VSAQDIDQSRLILLEDGHCLRDQALAFCATAPRSRNGGAASGGGMTFGASSLATVMQMVANGYGNTLIPQIAADVELRDERVKFLRFQEPQPGRTIGLVYRRTSPRQRDFVALAGLVRDALGAAPTRCTNRKGG